MMEREPVTYDRDSARSGVYCLAGVCVRIVSLYDDVHRLCAEYQSQGVPELTVRTGLREIEAERSKLGKAWKSSQMPSDAYLETIAAYRQIAEAMPSHGAFLVHGSCLAVDGEAYLFCAPSGTGKSTHARLWRELLGDRVTMVNDDKPLVRLEGKRAVAHGTPWDGKHRLSSRVAVPLRAVCLLARDRVNHVERVSLGEAYADLLRHVYRPADPAALSKTLSLAQELAGNVGLWRLGCNMEREAAELAFAAMSGGMS